MMVDQFGWLATLASGSAFALVGVVMWLFIGAGQGLLAISQSHPARSQHE